jgi:hypothetical protein
VEVERRFAAVRCLIPMVSFLPQQIHCCDAVFLSSTVDIQEFFDLTYDRSCLMLSHCHNLTAGRIWRGLVESKFCLALAFTRLLFLASLLRPWSCFGIQDA